MTGETLVGAERAAGEELLVVEGLSKTYHSRRGDVRAIDDISATVRRGEFVSIVGPSGCGKTTLMMCLAGLIPLSEGSIQFAGKPVSGPPPNLAVVFQDYSRSLFPWLTIHKNIAMPVADDGHSKQELIGRTERLLDSVGLPPRVRDMYPWQLSGGMQQRVAIARALNIVPELLLMDEPFASVDAQTRANLEDLLLDLWRKFNKTILFVTHDIDEAVYLSDRIVVLSPGPSHVKSVVDVRLPRPRRQIETKEHPEFGKIRSSVFRMVMGAEETAP